VAIVAVLVVGTGALLFSGKKKTTRPRRRRPRQPRPRPRPTTIPISFSPVDRPLTGRHFGKAPTVVVPAGAPPTKPELSNLITGTGAVAVGDKFDG
jgi:hypothetical protein